MARKIEKQRDWGMARIVKILPRPRKQRRSHKFSFRFDSSRGKVKNYRLYSTLCLAPTDSHQWNSVEFNSNRTRQFEHRREIVSSRFHDPRFEASFGKISRHFVRASTFHVRFNTFRNRAWWSRRTCPFNRRKWRRESRPMSWRFHR